MEPDKVSRCYRTSGEREDRRRSTEADIESLARKLYTPSPGGDLDPHSTTFDAKRWVQSVANLWGFDASRGAKRKLGVAFSKLSVSGIGSTAPKYQQSAGGVLLDLTTSVARRLGGVRRPKDTPILRDFEGVVEDGELLLVLGPPGSGCSTLLKTIAGETTGLRVSPNANINFRGEWSLDSTQGAMNTGSRLTGDRAHWQESGPNTSGRGSGATCCTTPSATSTWRT